MILLIENFSSVIGRRKETDGKFAKLPVTVIGKNLCVCVCVCVCADLSIHCAVACQNSAATFEKNQTNKTHNF